MFCLCVCVDYIWRSKVNQIGLEDIVLFDPLFISTNVIMQILGLLAGLFDFHVGLVGIVFRNDHLFSVLNEIQKGSLLKEERELGKVFHCSLERVWITRQTYHRHRLSSILFLDLNDFSL